MDSLTIFDNFVFENLKMGRKIICFFLLFLFFLILVGYIKFLSACDIFLFRDQWYFLRPKTFVF